MCGLDMSNPGNAKIDVLVITSGVSRSTFITQQEFITVSQSDDEFLFEFSERSERIHCC